MKYFLLTKSGHEIELTDDQRRRVEQAITARKRHIAISSNLLSIVDIAGVYDQPKPRKGQWYCQYDQWHNDGDPCGCYELHVKPSVQAVFWPDKQLQASKPCRGQFSIQKEINDLAKKYPDWAKRINDKNWREAAYQKLLTTDKQWCDYKTNTCSCNN